MAKKNIIVMDTETCPQPNVRFVKGPVPEKSLCYDIGWLVRQKRGSEVFERRSFVVAEVFFDNALMKSAYYASKIPLYRKSYQDGGAWKILPASEILQRFRDDCKDYGVSEIWAFNSSFDQKALNATAKYLSGGWASYWAPYGTKYFDIWKAAEKLTGTKAYVRWCVETGHVSEKHNPQTNVETIISYLMGEDVIEQHTGLADVEYESLILEKLMRFSHTPNPKVAGQGWRAASKVLKSLIADGEFTDAYIEARRLERVENVKDLDTHAAK